jgi:hypothetical protein
MTSISLKLVEDTRVFFPKGGWVPWQWVALGHMLALYGFRPSTSGLRAWPPAIGNDTVSIARATIHFGTAPPKALYMGLEARAVNKKCQGPGKEAPFSWLSKAL